MGQTRNSTAVTSTSEAVLILPAEYQLPEEPLQEWEQGMSQGKEQDGYLQMEEAQLIQQKDLQQDFFMFSRAK